MSSSYERTPASWTSARDRSAPGSVLSTIRSSMGRARRESPASKIQNAASSCRRRAASSSAGGVSCAASSASSPATTGAPLARAERAASSNWSATAASGPSAARARWRARSSGPTASCARIAWASRLRPASEPSYAAAARSGCVKRTRPSCELDHLPGDGRLQRAPRVSPRRRRDDLERRVCERSGEEQHLACPVGKLRDPCADEIAKTLRNDEARTRPTVCRVVRERADELEREQWVAPGRRVDLPERRRREDPAEARLDQVMHVLESERRDPNPGEPWQARAPGRSRAATAPRAGVPGGSRHPPRRAGVRRT